MPKRDFEVSVNPNDYPITLAMRIYGEARGKGLARSFLEPTIRHYMFRESGTRKEGIWIETSVDNIPVVRSFGNLGFVQVTQPDERLKILLVGSKENIVHLLPLAT